jgi:hypothetical protein
MNNGGFSGLAKTLGQAGRAGDTKVGTVTPIAQAFLRMAGGSGTTNPWTGLTEYAREETFDADWYLQNNPDVAAAGVDAWEHYNTMGRTEGRLGNETEYNIRTNEGYTGNFGGGEYNAWRDSKLNEIGARDADGNIRSDLLGGNVDVSAAGNMDDLIARIQARANDYMGDWGSGGYGRYMENYSDHDGDGVWTASNNSNIDRYGNDVSGDRQAFRDIGFDLEWGAGDAEEFWNQFLNDNPTFSGGVRDADQFLANQGKETAQDTFEDQMGTFMDQLLAAFGGVNQASQQAQGNTLGDLLMGILGSNTGQAALTPGVYGGSGYTTMPTSSGAFGNMRAVFNPMTGRTEWVPLNSFGGFASAFSGGNDVSSSSNGGRRSGFGSLIMV